MDLYSGMSARETRYINLIYSVSGCWQEFNGKHALGNYSSCTAYGKYSLNLGIDVYHGLTLNVRGINCCSTKHSHLFINGNYYLKRRQLLII